MSLLAFLLLAAGSVQSADLGGRIETEARKVAAPERTRVGVAVREARSGRLVCAFDARRPLRLASNTKLLTTAAALALLGPDFRFRTAIGTAEGDLHVVAGGDPNISGRFHDGDPVAVFRGWAAKLRAAGIDRVGDIVLHTGIFDAETLNPGWAAYDDEAWKWWRAPFGPLSLNDNCVDITVTGGAEGGPMRVMLSPDTAYVTVVNRSRTGPKGTRALLRLDRKAGTNTITVGGTASPGATFKTYSVPIRDPARWFGTVLRETLAREKVQVTGDLRVEPDSAGPPPEFTVHATLESGLAETLQVCNRRSQNFYAEMLLRTVGWKTAGKGTRRGGLDAVRTFLVDTAGLEDAAQEDGSGLTRENRASASDLAALLVHMYGSPHAKVFIDSLAVSGDPGGTLRRRLRDASVRGRVRAKSGYLSGVSALSGYAESRGGTVYAFSVLVNVEGGGSVGPAIRLQDRICELLVRDGGE